MPTSIPYVRWAQLQMAHISGWSSMESPTAITRYLTPSEAASSTTLSQSSAERGRAFFRQVFEEQVEAPETLIHRYFRLSCVGDGALAPCFSAHSRRTFTIERGRAKDSP